MNVLEIKASPILFLDEKDSRALDRNIRTNLTAIPYLDRVVLTEDQCNILIGKLFDEDEPSRLLANPSIQEFLLQIEPMEEDKELVGIEEIAFMKSAIKTGSIEVPDTPLVYLPLIDAHIKLRGSFVCNHIVTLCQAARTKADGKEVLPSTTQFILYECQDAYTKKVREELDRINKETEIAFERWIKFLYQAVQLMSIQRPEILAKTESLRVSRHAEKSIKGAKRQINKTKCVKIIRPASDDPIFTSTTAKRKITCPCWGVAGHYRNYKKSGKKIWIKPYRKGEKRYDPADYRPKEYVFQDDI